MKENNISCEKEIVKIASGRISVEKVRQPVSLTEGCDDFSPVDDTKDREEYYEQTLRERHEDYMEVVEEYK